MKLDSYHTPVWACALLILLLALLPTGFEGQEVFQESDIHSARVLSTDESSAIDTGPVRSGEQRCQLEILRGPFRGRIAEGRNLLNGSLEQDKLFAAGDTALVRINCQGEEILNVPMIDHYRAPWELLHTVIGSFGLVTAAPFTALCVGTL